MNLLERINRFLVRIEERPYHAESVIFFVLLVGLLRSAEENFLLPDGIAPHTIPHFTAFYFAVFLGFTSIVAVFVTHHWQQAAQVVKLGILVGALPPLLDSLLSQPGSFEYYYLENFHPLFVGSDNPPGEIITVWLSLALLGGYILLRTRSFLRAAIGCFAAYAYLMFLVYFYIEFARLIRPFLIDAFKVGTLYAALFLFLSFLLYCAVNVKRFWPSLKRINHTLPWVFLVFLGSILSGKINAITCFYAANILFIHQGIVLINDYYDRHSDHINQRPSLLNRNDVIIISSIILLLAVNVFLGKREGFIYLLYILLTTLYHHPTTRLKDIFPFSYLIEGLVAILALLLGIVAINVGGLDSSTFYYLLAAFVGFAFGSLFKDYKDIAGDRSADTRTLYTLLLDRGYSIEKIHQAISVSLVILLCGSLLWLYFMEVRWFFLPGLFLLFVIPIFFALKSSDKTRAVERTVWLLNGYLLSLVLVLSCRPLVWPATSTVPGQVMTDYGRLQTSAQDFTVSEPQSAHEALQDIRYASRHHLKIRIRGAGHSANGSSLPRVGEMLLLTDRLRHYLFTEPDTITTGAGVRILELKAFLEEKGFSLPVYTGGQGGPTVGGYIAAGGIGVTSSDYGGFWENTLELQLINGNGELITLTPEDNLFRWIFGSMGELGLVVQAKVKILSLSASAYPLGETGVIPAELPAATTEERPLYWFTLFVPTADLALARTELQSLMQEYAGILDYLPSYEWSVRYFHFNPPLLYPFAEAFVGIGIWGQALDPGRPETVLSLEAAMRNLVQRNRDRHWRRYLQTEVVAPTLNYREYFGESLVEEFLMVKATLDPQSLFGCGLLVPCPTLSLKSP